MITLEEKLAKKSLAEIAIMIRGLAINKNAAYKERNELVAFVSRLYYSHLCQHLKEDLEWDHKWRWIVCVHSPSGQLTWHIHDSELRNFKHLKNKPEHWDGHTTPQKYQRLKRLPKNNSV